MIPAAGLEAYGLLPAQREALAARGTKQEIPARVTAVHKERYELVSDRGECFGRLKSSVYYNGGDQPFPTTGDFVLIAYNESGDSVVTQTLPRRSYFARRNPTLGQGEQAVAANFDSVFIMQSLNFDFNVKRMERYLTLAWQSGATPVIVLTKADLVKSWDEQLLRASETAAGVEIFAVSAKTGYGFDRLANYLAPGRTIVLLGSSGVGKSSFVNALAGEDLLAVNAIREDDSKGRHTTTCRQLIRLDSGVMIIDTPGMRELGMLDSTAGLSESFADVEQYASRCRFSDCRHSGEPGCEVQAAIARGDLSRSRWESYQKLQRETSYSTSQADYLRQKQQRFTQIAKLSKEIQKSGGKRGRSAFDE
ncbi:MAG: ribosome small subunit-dependent GTPase A [Eubacteriales bacterium]|nr:ribosome small subunit-dependent GTPase A [Eubacteriales bacterium]